MPVTKYIYDGDNVLMETDGAGVTQKTYTTTAQGYGDLLSAFDGSSARYFEPDALGSTDALSDSTQAVTDRWRYRAFGTATHTTGTDPNPFTWVGRQGYYSDSETDLYLLGSGTRYYATDVNQFLSDDPIDFAGGDANLRRYAQNSPLNRIDANGLKCKVDLHYKRVVGFRHWGLTIETDVAGLPTDFYMDAGPIEGSLEGLIGTSGNQFVPMKPDGRYKQDLNFAANDDTCRCLWEYKTTFNNAKLPYELDCRNSNWALHCMLKHCGLGMDWAGSEPIGWDCKKVCVEWRVWYLDGVYCRMCTKEIEVKCP